MARNPRAMEIFLKLNWKFFWTFWIISTRNLSAANLIRCQQCSLSLQQLLSQAVLQNASSVSLCSTGNLWRLCMYKWHNRNVASDNAEYVCMLCILENRELGSFGRLLASWVSCYVISFLRKIFMLLWSIKKTLAWWYWSAEGLSYFKIKYGSPN